MIITRNLFQDDYVPSTIKEKKDGVAASTSDQVQDFTPATARMLF